MEDWDRLQSAYNILADPERRREYDEQIGLLAKRRGRMELRPLGLHSRSLNPTQQRWTIWERELLAAL